MLIRAVDDADSTNSRPVEVSTNIIEKLVTVTVDLPEISAVSELDVDTTSNSIIITSKHLDRAITVNLPRPVDADGATAKFLKKRRQLTITVPFA